MTDAVKKDLALLKKTLTLARTYSHAIGLINFDFETCAPVKARENEGDTISFLSNEHFRLLNSKKVKALIVRLYENKDQLSPLFVSLIEKLYDGYLKTKNVTPKKQLEWSKIYNKAYIDWFNAKEADDFKLFKKSFAKVVSLQKEQVALRENALNDVYDELLNDCEKGVLTADLDVFFGQLKTGLTTLLEKIKNSDHNIRTDFLSRKVPIYKQEEFSRYLLELNGYDFERGYLTTTEHPFTSDIAKDDARVTTHYYEDMVLSNVYSVIHEGGHAIFMQNEPEEDHAHFINDYVTNGMHESVSRFYENVIGRSKEYIHLIYPKFQEIFKEEFSDVTERELYEAANVVAPSLIRTEADEVTYGLHIVIRYEMEKSILSGETPISDVPAKWNELYKEYLGVTPTGDRDGVLQDVHWSGGFGYFPSYALGNAYNAMYLKEIKKAMDFKGAISSGAFAAIKGWMRENVFRFANVLSPKEWLYKLTGRSLTAEDFLEYLNEKYSEIYKF